MFMCYTNKLLLQRLVAGLSPHMAGFDTRSVYLGFVVDKVPLRQVTFCLLRFSSFSIILPPVNNHFHLHVALTKRSKGQKPRNLPRISAHLETGTLDRKLLLLSFLQSVEVKICVLLCVTKT